jgi:hypothetical protein
MGWVASIRQESRRLSERIMEKSDRIAGGSADSRWFATQLRVRSPRGATDTAA